MVVSSLIPNKVLVCGGRHLSKEESNGSGKLESETERTAVEIDCQELRLALVAKSVDQYQTVLNRDNGIL
jgi:hypothetical protein